jgi:hypothetical protein
VYEVDADSAALAEAASADNPYDDLVGIADSLLLAKNYQLALNNYQEAIKLKPGEIYAHGKIDGINKTLAEFAAKEAEDKKKAELALQQQKAKEEAEKQAALLANNSR